MSEEKLYQGIWKRKEASGGELLPDRAKEALKVLNIGETLLDVGCGDGQFADLARGKYKYIIGLDLSQTALISAKSKEISSVKTNLNKGCIPLKNECVDAATCLDAVEHVLDPYHLFREIHRVLRKQGDFILTTPNARFIKYISDLIFKGMPPKTSLDFEQYDGGHLHYFTFKDKKKLLYECGFETVQEEGIALRFYKSFKLRIFYLLSKLWENDPKKEFFSLGILIKARKKDENSNYK